MALSLWLFPVGTGTEELKQMILELSDEFKTNAFLPHVSLPFSFECSQEEAIHKLDTKFLEEKKFFVEFDDLYTGMTPHTQVFFEFKETNDLEKLNYAAKNAFYEFITKERMKPFHMSLIYADTLPEKNFSDANKERIITMVKEMGYPKSICLGELAIMERTSEKLNEWKVVHSIKLK